MSKFFKHTWSFVVNAVRLYNVIEFMRDHFDDLL
jgi:hypothetical protein